MQRSFSRECVRFLLILFCIAIPGITFAQKAADRLHQLDAAMDSAGYFNNLKWQQIRQIQSDTSTENTPAAQFANSNRLYEAYKVFRFDSAFYYANRMLTVARESDQAAQVVAARSKLAFVLISAGLYREANDNLNSIDIRLFSDSLKSQYYLLRARYYYDLSDYNSDDAFAPVYIVKAGDYIDSALVYCPNASFEYLYYTGLRQLKSGDLNHALANFQQVMQQPGIDAHQLAITASTLSYIYSQRHLNDSALDYQARAALADIHASTKETFAMLNLAQMLFTEGQFQRAARYIKKSVDDASFYGARQRKVQLSTLLPIIQGSELNYIKQQRSYAIIYSAVISLILLLFAFLLVVIFRQNKRLRKTQEELRAAHTQLSEAHARQQQLNQILQQANTDLLDLNHRLEDANKIKEEYVGYFLNTSADSSQKFERLKLAIEEKLHYGKTAEIKYLLNGYNIHNEKQELLKSFDRVFLKLFPHFVTDFNNLLEEDHRIVLPEDQLLNTDLRIYALQRVGIRENEKIAEILEYSVKSIYAYKTRIRNRSRFPKENFDQLVMNIRSV